MFLLLVVTLEAQAEECWVPSPFASFPYTSPTVHFHVPSDPESSIPYVLWQMCGKHFCLQCHKMALNMTVCCLEDAHESIPISYLSGGKRCLSPGSKKCLLLHL